MSQKILNLIGGRFAGILNPDSNTYSLLLTFSDAVFYFLPIFLAYSSARGFRVKPVLAMLIAGVMLHPNYLGLEMLHHCPVFRSLFFCRDINAAIKNIRIQ